MCTKTVSNPIASLPFVQYRPDGSNFLHAPMPEQCDNPYGDGCSAGYRFAADYLAMLRRESHRIGDNTIGCFLSAMPWDTYNARVMGNTPEQTYQKGVMVGFFCMLERLIGIGVRVADPHEVLRQHEQFYASREAEVKVEERAARSNAARKGWKTRRVAA